MRILSLAVLLQLLFAVEARATHIIGGEIYYDHLGGNQYRVTLDLYRDCSPANTNNTGFDASVQIRAFNNASGGIHATNNVSFSGETIVPLAFNNPCLTAPPNVCVSTARYQTTFNLPPNAGGYTVSYQRCCRVPSILNLVQPGNQGLTCTVRIPGQPNNENSSPRFANYPPIVICLGEELQFDHSAIDPDGDVLTYSLCTPLLGGTVANPAPAPVDPPYAPVPWGPGYSVGYQLDSSPPMTVDPVTGLLIVKPTQQGSYAVGVCVQEYRNGVLISESSRDFMFTVVVCDAAILSVVAAQAPSQLCIGLTQNFFNQSTNGQTWYWDFGDPSTEADTSALLNPSWTYAQPGTYTVMLVANPGWVCADTSFAEYQVYMPVNAMFEVPPYACGTGPVEYLATGDFSTAAQVVWNFGASAQPATVTGNPATTILPTNGSQLVVLTVTENGCVGNFAANVTVFPAPIAVIQPQTQFCSDLSIAFANGSSSSTAYRWDFGDPGTLADTSLSTNPSWAYAQPGTYTVSLVASGPGPCADTTSAIFEVYPALVPSFIPPDTLCTNEQATFTVDGIDSPTAGVFWNFGSAASQPIGSGFSTSVSYPDQGVYPVTVVVSEYGCTGSYTDTVVVYPYPVANFTSLSELCHGSLFDFQDLSTGVDLSHSWDFDDGSTSTEQDPYHRYSEPGSYTVSYTVSTSNACVGSDTIERTLQVHPNPVADFTATPEEVNVAEGCVDFIDASEGADSWTYFVDGSSFEEQDPSYCFRREGRYMVFQYVETEHGCRDSTSRMVYVSDHIFWAPNAFTPNGDGVNDTFAPLAIGVREYELMIHDRWGIELLRSTDPKAQWAGDGMPDGIYIYTVRIKEWGALSRVYQGHFTLIR